MIPTGARPEPPLNVFIERVERLGAMYKWWHEYDGALRGKPDRAIDHCINVGLVYRVDVENHSSRDLEWMIDLVEKILESSGKEKLDRWTFVDYHKTKTVFLFETDEPAMTMRLYV